MAQAKVVTAQTDFSAGAIDAEAKRDNKSPLTLAGTRQASNFRILNAKGVTNRSGRRALFLESDRVEEVLMAPGVTYYLVFRNADLRIYNSAGTLVFDDSARPWSAATAKNAVWALFDKSIYVTFTGMVPRVLTWNGVTTWTAADYAETVSLGGQKRTIFYRISPKNWTMFPSAVTGAITVQFSANFLVAGHVGTRMRYIGRQFTITGINSPSNCNATVNETLPGSQFISFGINPNTIFSLGDLVQGTVSGAQGYIVTLNATQIGVQLMSAKITGIGSTRAVGSGAAQGEFQLTAISGFNATDVVVGPGGSIQAIGIAPIGGPNAVPFWDEEVINALQGYPQSVFVDQSRLGFCNFPTVPSGVGWSALADPNDLYVDAQATSAMFELVPGKRQVLYVIPGMDASEFVFCDKGLLYVPITSSNPLKPGSVTFSTISEDECGQVQPRRVGEIIIYAAAGLSDVMVVKIFGAYSRAYKTECVNELSGHLFGTIAGIAVMTSASTFSERYAFVLNSDGSVVVGKYSLGKSNDLEGAIGWTPWTGGGTVAWVSCKGGNVLFTSVYPAIGAVSIVELLDDSRYLDASQLYNTQPSGLPIPVGKGPLWYGAGGTVDLMDGPLGTRMMGTYLIDANGFLIPQGNGGEDLTSVNLRVGQPWTARLEPFVPPVQAGQDVDQRMYSRRISRAQVYVKDSSGFVMQRLYSGQSGPLLPVTGTVMKERRISTWNQGEDPTQPPTLREQAYLDRPIGRSHDPRWLVVKDTPGPLTILETSFEVTV